MKKNMVFITLLSAAIMGGSAVAISPSNTQNVSAAVTTVTSTKAALNAMITKASTVQSGTWNAASYDALQSAVGRAKMVTTTKDSSQNEIDFTTQLLSETYNMGNTIANHFGLTYVIDSASEATASDYTAASFAAVQTAIATAKTVNTNKAATQTQVDAQINALESTLAKLAFKVTVPQTIKATVAVHYVKGYGIQIYNTYKAGRKAVIANNGKAKKLNHGTTWKAFKVISYDGHQWYNLGGNQWVKDTYVVVNK